MKCEKQIISVLKILDFYNAIITHFSHHHIIQIIINFLRMQDSHFHVYKKVIFFILFIS